MSDNTVTGKSVQRSYRTPVDLDEAISAYAAQRGIPRNAAAIELWRKALYGDSLGDSNRDSESDSLGDSARAIADLTVRLEAIEAHLATGESQPQVAINGTKRLRRGVLNPATQWLDSELCPAGHTYADTGKTRRDRSGRCLECARLGNEASRAKRKAQTA